MTGSDLVDGRSNPVKANDPLNRGNNLARDKQFGKKREVVGSRVRGELVERRIRSPKSKAHSHEVKNGPNPLVCHRTADTNKASARGKDALHFGGGSVAHHVEHNVILTADSDVVSCLVVDHATGTKSASLVNIVATADGSDLCRAEGSRNLHGEGANSPGCTIDKHPVARLEGCLRSEPLQCREPCHWGRPCRHEVDPRRQFHKILGCDRGVFREGTTSSFTENSIADLKTCDAVGVGMVSIARTSVSPYCLDVTAVIIGGTGCALLDAFDAFDGLLDALFDAFAESFESGLAG
jgi:hypothetical protein